MRRRLSRALGQLRAIAGGSPLWRNGPGRRTPRSIQARPLRLESLEQRTLLSIGTTADEPLPVSWAPTVDAAWFQQLAPAREADVRPASLQLEAESSPQPMVRPLEAIAAAPDQWLVQLTAEATRLAGSVAGTVDLLETSLFKTQVVGGLGLQGMVLLQTEAGAELTTVEAWLADNPYVAYAEPDSALATEALPNDDAFSALWGLHNTGQTGGTVDADIDAPEAWEISTGRASIVVAVTDTGVDYTHPDLAANIWVNPGEVPGNGIDDDGNGFVDDVHGYDFVNRDGDPRDDNGHGTHVSGTIAAVGNNGQGITGVNWTGSVMALKFLDAQGNGFTSAAVQALNYATMMRSTYGVDVRVTSNSWGGSGYSHALYDAVRASGEAGILFVAAAGNEGIDSDVQAHYPSSFDLPNVIAVAASDHNDRLASFSNYGPVSVDLAAPGVNIQSTLPGGGYGAYGGTSMATPHVAGTAALAWSTAPSAGVQQVRGAILDGADRIASLSGKVATGGRLNARNTLERLSLGVAASDPSAGSIVATAPVEFTVWFTHQYDPLTIDAADLVVNGITADRAALSGGNTVTFQFDATPVASEGPQVMEIRDGTILRAGDGEPISAWQATFFYDALPLAVISTAPSQGEIVAAAPAQIVLHFNEPVDPYSVDVGDLSLSVGSATGATVLDADSVSYTVVGLPREGEVTYALVERALGDAHGTPGPAYVGGFTIDDPLIEWYASANVPKNITDYGTILSTLVINDSYAIADLDVQIEITHTYDADLDAYLVAPNGTRIALFDRVGGSGNDFSGTILDDEAETAITAGQAPFSGRYRPQQPLSAVDGLDVMGTWTLEIGDHGARDQGILNGWAIIVERSHDLPPRIRSIDRLPPGGGDVWGILDGLDVHFSKPMDPSGVNDASSWQLLEAGPDGLLDTADDIDYALAVSPPYVDGLTARLETGVGPLPPGSYRLTAASGGLADPSGAPLDGDGNGIGGDDYVTQFRLLPADWYPSGDVPKPISDLRTITSTLSIEESFPIGDLDLKIDISHTYDADLNVYLITPNGTRIELFTDVGGSGDNFSGTILDDEAATPIADGHAPFSDRYRPEQPLSAVDGSDAKGTWTLEISDDGGMDQGTLNAWAMIVKRGLNVPPRISSIDPLPPDGGQIWGPLERFEVHFSEVMDATSVNDPSHWQLLGAGRDGQFETGDDVDYVLTVTPAYVDGLTATLQPNVGPLPPGSYRLTGASGGLADLFGSPLDGDSDGSGGDDYVTRFVILPSNRYASADVPKDLIDFKTIRSTVTVDESFTIADVDVQVFITHTYDNDVDAYLIAPDGTRIELFTDVGGSDDGFAATVLDDEAATPITSGRAPFAGRYQPEGLLSLLDGSNAAGTWTLEITDDAIMDQGTLDGWALILEPDFTIPPRIVGHVPDDLTAGPVGTIRLDFDRPMDDRSFSLSDDVLSFAGPQGPIVPTAYNWVDPQCLEILFDPQEAAGTYTMVLGPQILDTTGTALDRDGDGVPGETPDDQYTASFVLAQALGAVDFTKLDDLDPSAGALWYHFETTRQGVLTLEADFQVGLGNVELALYDDSGSGAPVAVSIPTYGNRRIDRQVTAPGEVYYLKLSGTNAQVDLHLANLLSRQGDTVTVFGTDGDDQFEFQTTTARQVTINTLRYEFDTAEVSSVVFQGGAGDDDAVFAGRDDEETVEMWPGRGVLTGNGYTVTANGVESVTARGGASDVAYLYDSGGGDTLIATPDYAELSGEGFSNRAERFGHVYAYATPGGGDAAFLYDNATGNDRLVATPHYAVFYGDGFSNRVESFRYVHAYASEGAVDVALLYDDPHTADTLEASPDSATFSGDGFYTQAVDFRSVHAFATEGGGDVAILHDDPNGADKLKAWPDQARLSGDGFYARVVSFGSVQALATKGSGDAAVLYDNPAGKDTFEATPTEAKLYGEGFHNRAESFDYVYGRATKAGGDVALLFDNPGSKDFLRAWPDEVRLYGDGFYNEAESFDYTYAYATEADDDVALLFDDPAGKDTLKAWPDQLTFSGEGFSNEANSFRYVLAIATSGGGDVAELYDDPNAPDVLKAWPDQARLYGDGFYNRAKFFDEVHAYATPGGGDMALLFDNPDGPDTFQAWPNQATLSGDGFRNEANSFRYVRAFGTRGHDDVAHLYGSAGNDIFAAWPDKGKLYSGEFYSEAKSFRYVNAYSGDAGYDKAYLYDSPLEGYPDYLEAQDNWARLSNDAIGYAYLAMDFERVEATSSNEGDSKDVGPTVDFLFTYGPW